jgi:hypothetical protein
MNSDGDKLYMKIVVFDAIYNFAVHALSFKVILRLKIIATGSVHNCRMIRRSEHCSTSNYRIIWRFNSTVI